MPPKKPMDEAQMPDSQAVCDPQDPANPAGEDALPPAPMATPALRPDPLAQDPRGESPMQGGQVAYPGGADASHTHQPVSPTRYAQEVTAWLSLPAAERAKTPAPKAPEGTAAHPLTLPAEPQEPAETGPKGPLMPPAAK